MIYKVEIAPGTSFISRPRCFTSTERYTCPFGWCDSIDKPTPREAAIAIVERWYAELNNPAITTWPVKVAWGENESVVLHVNRISYFCLRADEENYYAQFPKDLVGRR